MVGRIHGSNYTVTYKLANYHSYPFKKSINFVKILKLEGILTSISQKITVFHRDSEFVKKMVF